MSITTQEKIGDNLAAAVVTIVKADGDNFPFTPFGPRDTAAEGKSRLEVRSGGFIRASDQMAQNPDGSWFYVHRRGFISGTVVSQRHAQTAIGPDSKHAEAVGRFRYLLSNVIQLLTPNACGYQIVDLIDQGDRYTADQPTRTDRTEVRFSVDLWIPPASYTP